MAFIFKFYIQLLKNFNLMLYQINMNDKTSKLLNDKGNARRKIKFLVTQLWIEGYFIHR